MEDNKDVKTEEVVKEETTKTYTQDDINNSYNAGFSKAKKELEKNEDYKNYLEWRKTNQNDGEKIAELEKQNATKEDKIKSLEALLKVSDSDVKKEFKKYVASEVSSLVNETTDFDTALKKYKNENPQFFGETVVKKVQSSPNLNNGGTKPSTINDMFNNMIRSA